MVKMSDISRILKTKRKEMGLTLAQIADRMGVSEATVQRWESGNIKSLRYERIEPLSKILQVSPSVLMGWESTPGIQSMPEFVKVPRLGSIACGTPILAEQNIECYDNVPEYVSCDFTLTCKGDSMINARIYDGDIVCIRQQSTVDNGEIAAVMVGDEEATLKRVYLYDDHIMLSPENPMYKPIVLWQDEMNECRIVGKATHFISVVK
jgi:repressor LexA